MKGDELILAIISTTLLVLLLIAGIIIILFLASRQRSRQQLELIQTRLTFERELRKVEMEIREHIMTDFASELHDNVGQLLTATHIHIENQKIDHPELVVRLQPIERYLGEVTQQLRLLSRTLNPDYIGNVGLHNAIQTEVERLEALNRFRVHWHSKDEGTALKKSQELLVFRIFQEITQNALRHAHAQHFYIELDTTDGFELTVSDDGCGFDLEQVLKERASGLLNIRNRANLAQIYCHMESQPGKGSNFVLKKTN